MTGVLLTVLKIIGILLLILFGTVLAILFTVLLVPVRYRARGSYHEKPEGVADITWLLHLIHLTIGYREDVFYTLKIAGHVFAASDHAEPDDTDGDKEGTAAGNEDGTVTGNEEESIEEAFSLGDSSSSGEKRDEETEPLPEGNASPDDLVHESLPEKTEKGEKLPEKKKRCRKKLSFTKWLERILSGLIRKISSAVRNIRKKWRRMEKKYRYIRKVIGDEKNRKTVRLLLRQIRRLAGHILPRKADGYVSFGFEDPETTARVLEACAFLYPFYRGCVSVTPYFDRNCLDGELTVTGRVRIGTVLWIVLRMFFDRNFRKWLKRLMHH
ncbi:hypothetical protein [[Clostridium] aminophilum]|uniref:DUF2953 domain-containing protein n=1 Tax=[Clostridium] aminophilum TaxID=1526 RepID=A0A1I6IN29_9FIRM|nr:hypothetical protein [[Clostridium] aminophilum]SFR68116.1 hypothetical protein SAMN02910262_00592 [[Clostridium] aminophilum]